MKALAMVAMATGTFEATSDSTQGSVTVLLVPQCSSRHNAWIKGESMKTLSVLALGAIVGLSVLPRVDAAAQFNQARDRARGDQVCVYEDINYQGPEQCYGVGEVSNLGTLRRSISSIRVYGRTTVTVYENTEFRGRSLQFTSDVSDLGRQMMAGNTAWSDHIDSLRVTATSGTPNVSDRRDRARGDQVCVYKDINYQGPEQCYGVGEVSNLAALRKSISSIRVYGRATVTVYENTEFRGRSAQFTSDVSDLGRQMMAGNTAWSDHIDSLRISGISGTSDVSGSGNSGVYPRNPQGAPRNGICVYELPNYKGRLECWNQGQSISDLARQSNWSGQISSIRLFGRAIAVVYQDAGYRGESLTVDTDIPDLAAVDVKNRGNGNARSQENSNGRGRGNARSANWDHQISSIHVQEQR
jgi:Peptidase inhibitor family I36